jgi:hypothetical protein
MGPGPVHVKLTCGGAEKVLQPIMEYTVSVHDPSKTLDWWTSSAGNNVYDEVRFAPDWRVLHYRWTDAPEGPCKIDPMIPEAKRMFPWTDPAAGVASIPRAEQSPVVFGSFLALQRAGGTYALVSGADWKRRAEPYRHEGGSAKIADHRFDWRIETNRSGPPWISVLSEGFGRYVVLNGSTVDIKTQIHIRSQKKITFPDGPVVKLHYKQDPDCAGVCREGKSSDLTVLEYNVDNSSAKDEHGFLNMVATVFLDPKPHFVDSGFDAEMQFPTKFERSGIWVDGSFASGKNESARKENPAPGAVHTKGGQWYYLNYLISVTLKTTGKGLDATHWMYRAKLTPSMLYFTK